MNASENLLDLIALVGGAEMARRTGLTAGQIKAWTYRQMVPKKYAAVLQRAARDYAFEILSCAGPRGQAAPPTRPIVSPSRSVNRT